jgi:acylphosphatase
VTRAVEVRVTGLVQGVSFRAYAAREAHRLGLAGWVRNETNGSVAGHFEGPDAAVEEMLAWCRDGPPAARVANVQVTEVTPTGATSFVIDF